MVYNLKNAAVLSKLSTLDSCTLDIAEIFNEYFVNIAREIPSHDANFYCSHFSNHLIIMNHE